MKRLIPSVRFCFAKYTEAPYKIGLMAQEPDLKGRELDKFRRYYNKVSLANAGQEMPNFEAQRFDLPTLERNEVAIT